MHIKFRPPGRRSRCAAGLAVAAVGALGLLSACGQSPHATHAGALTPGPGQNRLAGTPGASGMPSMTMPMGTPSTATAAKPVSGHAVTIRNFAFSPATLKVKAGTTVTWTNQDTDAHTVTSNGSGGPLHSSALAPQATYSHTFTRPGSYAYVCTIHPFMTGTVEVTS